MHAKQSVHQFTVLTDEAFHIHQSSYVCKASVKVHVLLYAVTIIQNTSVSDDWTRRSDVHDVATWKQCNMVLVSASS